MGLSLCSSKVQLSYIDTIFSTSAPVHNMSLAEFPVSRMRKDASEESNLVMMGKYVRSGISSTNMVQLLER